MKILFAFVLVVYQVFADENTDTSVQPNGCYKRTNKPLTPDECRTLHLNEPIIGKALPGHVIANKTVGTEMLCRTKCFMNPDCISVNYNTTPEATPNCQLSSSSNESLLVAQKEIVYQSSKNDCIGKECPLVNMTCQAGFGVDGYRCACPKCYTGDHCDKHTQDTVLVFPDRSIKQVIEINKPFTKNLQALTVSMWLQITVTDQEPTFFSYATTANHNEIMLGAEKEKLRILFKRKRYVLVNICDGEWHHIAVTWESSTGELIIYKDGKIIEKHNVREGEQIDEGALVLGQDQDSQFGRYQSHQSFQGNITGVNVWDKVLPGNEIEDLAINCEAGQEGNLVKWSKFLSHRNDYIGYYCDITCNPSWCD